MTASRLTDPDTFSNLRSMIDDADDAIWTLRRTIDTLKEEIASIQKEVEPGNVPTLKEPGKPQLTPYGRQQLRQFYRAGGTRTAAAERFEITYSAAHNHWKDYKAELGQEAIA